MANIRWRFPKNWHGFNNLTVGSVGNDLLTNGYAALKRVLTATPATS